MRRKFTLAHILGRLLLALVAIITATGTAAPRSVQAQPAPLPVTVTITRVDAHSCPDSDLFGCHDADFYALIWIDGNKHVTPEETDQQHIRPSTGWSYTVEVDRADDIATIEIELRDADGGLRGPYDSIDIAGSGEGNLKLEVNLRNCGVRGEQPGGCWRPIVSRGNDGNTAEIELTIDVKLPNSTFWGVIYDGQAGDRSQPIQAHAVRLVDVATGVSIEETNTDAYGVFALDTRPPADAQVRLEVAACMGAISCDYAPPDVAPIYTQPDPSQVEPRSLVFGGCPPEGFCRYAPVDFFIDRKVENLSAIALNEHTSPAQPTPRALLNDSRYSQSTVRFRGANLHSWLEFWLLPQGCGIIPGQPVPGCAHRVKYALPNGAEALVEMPALEELGPEPFRTRWSWAVRDALPRPGYSEWSFQGPFHLNYAGVYGFGFANISDQSDATSGAEFEAVFGDNTRICVGKFGLCLFHIPDPFAWLYYETIYKAAAGGEGECAGMASTALRMQRNELSPQLFSQGAYFAHGLPGAPENDGLPPRPQQFNPRNLWGEILMNQGVQASAEGFNAYMDDTGKNGLFSIDGDPIARLAELRADPSAHVVCMSKGTGGHCVTVYDVQDIDTTRSRLLVYDNRYPQHTNDFIEIDLRANTYQLYQGEGNPDPTYNGTHLTTLPISIWGHERNIPGLLDAARFGLIMIFGAAVPRYVAPDGATLGTQPDGSFVSALPGARLITPFSQASARATPLIALGPQAGAPTIELGTQGGEYGYAAIGDGLLFKLDVQGSPAGASDQIRPMLVDGTQRGFTFSTAQLGVSIAPQIALAPAARQRAVFRWAGLGMGAGGTVNFSADRAAYQVGYHNGTAAATRHTLVLEHIDGEAEVTSKSYFGPFSVPAGATQTATIIDWPAATRLRIDTDRNGDGVADRSEVVRGVVAGERASEGLQALYTFTVGAGTNIPDVAGVGSPADLSITNPAATRWQPDGLTITPGAGLRSATPAARVSAALSATNEVTLEAWVTSDGRVVRNTGSLVALGGTSPTLVLAQGEAGGTRSDRFNALIPTDAAPQGVRLRSRPRAAKPGLTHLALTRDATGVARLYVNGALQTQRAVPGRLVDDPQALITLADSLDGAAGWAGVYHLVAIYNRALSPAEVAENMGVGPRGDGFAPATQLQSLYTFEMQGGSVVQDVARTGLPHDLTITNPAAVHWMPGGLELLSSTIISSTQAATKLTDAATDTGEITIEAWARPQRATVSQTGRMVTISASPTSRNFSMTQAIREGRYVVRLNTTRTRTGGQPLWAPKGSSRAALSHIVYTRDRLGLARLYIDGVEVAHDVVPGTLTSWDKTYRLALGNDFTNDRPWLGEYQRIALYNRALSPAEVAQHMAAGPADTP